jgi:hypothetical protein
MPNLEQNAVTEWLTELRPPTAASEWPPPIRAIEAEADNPERLLALGAVLDRVVEERRQELSTALREAPLRDDLTAVLAQLGAARLMRLVHWLAEAEIPDCHAVIAALIGSDDAAGEALRAAVAAVTRRALLRLIFAPDRIAALRIACQTALEETV